MELEMRGLPKILQKRRGKRKTGETCKRNGIVFMAIFGSFSRREQKKTSDIDIAIEFGQNKEKVFLIWFTWKTG
jgi:predicted nucleotidyltransferase